MLTISEFRVSWLGKCTSDALKAGLPLVDCLVALLDETKVLMAQYELLVRNKEAHERLKKEEPPGFVKYDWVEYERVMRGMR